MSKNTQIAKRYNDEFWGNGNGKPYGDGRPAKYPAGGGENQLGKILMEIRDELKKSQGSKPDPNPPPQSPPTNPSQPNAPNGGPNSPNPNPNSPNPP
ncbi:27216_t:CDS:2, partial [Racocetra persica]